MVLYRVRVITIPVFVRIGPGNKHKQGIICYGPVYHLHAVIQPPVTKAVDIIARGGNADHQLVRVGLHRLFEAVVLRRFFKSVHLVRNGDVAIERILRVRVRRQSLNIQASAGLPVIVREFVVYGMLRVIVPDPENLNQPVIPQRVQNIVERLARLFQRRGDNVYLRAAPALQEGQAKRQGGNKQCLAVLAGDKNERLFVSAFLRSFVIEACDVVDAEDLPRLEEDGRIHERCAVQGFPLFMHHDPLDDADDKIRLPRVDGQVVALKIRKKPFCRSLFGLSANKF